MIRKIKIRSTKDIFPDLGFFAVVDYPEHRLSHTFYVSERQAEGYKDESGKLDIPRMINDFTDTFQNIMSMPYSKAELIEDCEVHVFSTFSEIC